MYCQNCQQKDSEIWNLKMEIQRLKLELHELKLRVLDVSKITTDEIKKILEKPNNESQDNDND